MEKIALTTEQQDIILAEVDGIEDGYFDIDIDVDDNMTVNVDGYLETDGYVERDTNAYVETYRHADVAMTATVYDEDGNKHEAEVEDDFCKKYLETIF